MFSEAAPLDCGTVVAGRFEIQGVVHRSGMSTVYRATDAVHEHQQVAIKAFSSRGLPRPDQEEALRWLAREAGLLSSLTDLHLPSLVAAFSEGEDHYVVMPYLQGETLKERVERTGPLPELEALRVARDLAEVLVYLHGQNPPIVHRDLKPANVLQLPPPAPPTSGAENEREPHVVLLDLGVARPLARGVAGTAIGTPSYAAPEQYQGLADERSDLYALGATLQYLLTGYDSEHEHPFRLPPLDARNAGISVATGTLIRALVQVVPEQRPSSAERVQRRLAEILQAQQSLVAASSHLKEWAAYAIGTGALAALLAIAAAGLFGAQATGIGLFSLVVELVLSWVVQSRQKRARSRLSRSVQKMVTWRLYRPLSVQMACVFVFILYAISRAVPPGAAGVVFGLVLLVLPSALFVAGAVSVRRCLEQFRPGLAVRNAPQPRKRLGSSVIGKG